MNHYDENIITLPDLLKKKNRAKVLIMRREGSLGDSILTMGYYESLKKFSTNIQTDVFCLYPAEPFLKTLPYIDNLYILGFSKLRLHRCWLHFLFWGLFFRLKNYDYVIDDNPYEGKNWAYFTWIIGKNKFVRTEKQFSSIKSKCRHIMEMLRVPWEESSLRIDKKSDEKLKSFLSERNIEKYIFLNCFASVMEKSFSADSFCRIVRLLRNNNMNLPILFPCQSKQKELAEQYLAMADKMLEGRANVFYFETHSPYDLFAAVSDKQCCLAITPDTSAVHIAAMYKKNIIVFYKDEYAFNNYRTENENAAHIYSKSGDVNTFSDEVFLNSVKRFLSSNEKE